MGTDKEKKKEKKKQKYTHKYDHIDNNYLIFDSRISNAMTLCGIATGISCLFFGVTPFGVLLYMMAVLERTQEYINQSTFILITCGAAIVGSLVLSIIAKVKYRESRWAVTNIVYISINMVKSFLVAFFFVWLMNTYGTT